MERESSLVGRQIGNYRLTAEIASGSFGTVYQAHHSILTNRVVALKVLHMHLPARDYQRFFQEAQLLEELQHPRILSIIDVGSDNGMLYLISTYAPGGTLRQLLDKTLPSLLPWNQILTILTQIGEALHHAHQQNIVHCDLKPDNILFNAQGEAVLADFGIATVLSSMSVKQLTDPAGTPSYMAPEQFRGEVSKQSDQYALGCIAYELVTGQRPFSAPDIIAMGFKHATEPPTPPSRINQQILPHVEQAILKALAKQRNDRYTGVAALLNALQTPSRKSFFHESVSQAARDTEKAMWHPATSQAASLKSIPEKPTRRSFHTSLPAQKTKEQWLDFGHIANAFGDNKKALEAYEQALYLDPNYAEAYSSKGRALFHLARYKEALGACEQALRLDPTNAEAYFYKGNALGSLAQYKVLHVSRFWVYKKALEAYEQALHLDPTNAQVYVCRGITLFNLKRYKKALEAFDQALYLDPKYTKAYLFKWDALMELKRYEEVVKTCDQALRLYPKYTKAYLFKWDALMELKRYEEALEAIEQVLRLDPNDGVAYSNKSLALCSLRRWTEAQEAREKARELGSV